MNTFEAQQFRDNLAKSIRETPREIRKGILDLAKSTPEYMQARMAKYSERQGQVEADTQKVTEIRENLGLQSESLETFEQKKLRVDGLWSAWDEVKDNPELVSLFDRKQEFASQQKSKEILQKNGYPERTKIGELQFENWTVNINPKFVKDGFVYLLRGDHPNLDKKGFYARPYGYGKLSARNLAKQLTPDEAGYFLYGDEHYLTTAESASQSTAEELALLQSKRGGSSFISTTTSIPSAEAGTGNVPDVEEQAQYEIYVLKVPLEFVINSNTGNHYGMEEDEYLVPDYISSNEVVATFSRSDRERVFQYLHKILGVTREDVRI